MFGIERQLEEHTIMIDRRVDTKLIATTQRIDSLDKEFHVHKLEDQEFRRRTDDSIKTIMISMQKQEASAEITEKCVQGIKLTLDQYLPILKDSEEKRATKHQLKESALWVSAVIGAIVASFALMGMVWLYVNNFLNLLVQ